MMLQVYITASEKYSQNLDSKLGSNLLVLFGERDGSVVECRTPEREIGGSKPTAAVLCP